MDFLLTFINPIALRKAKIVYNFDLSGCKRVSMSLGKAKELNRFCDLDLILKDIILYAHYLLKQWMDFLQACMDLSLEQAKAAELAKVLFNTSSTCNRSFTKLALVTDFSMQWQKNVKF